MIYSMFSGCCRSCIGFYNLEYEYHVRPGNINVNINSISSIRHPKGCRSCIGFYNLEYEYHVRPGNININSNSTIRHLE